GNVEIGEDVDQDTSNSPQDSMSNLSDIPYEVFTPTASHFTPTASQHDLSDMDTPSVLPHAIQTPSTSGNHDEARRKFLAKKGAYCPSGWELTHSNVPGLTTSTPHPTKHVHVSHGSS
ncbi:unnamed protein product, partial [Owenia fusiformis]